MVRKGRLELKEEVRTWIARAEALPFFRFVPVDNAIALLSVELPHPLHPDPADRIIVATALRLQCPLVTKDRQLHEYPDIEVIW